MAYLNHLLKIRPVKYILSLLNRNTDHSDVEIEYDHIHSDDSLKRVDWDISEDNLKPNRYQDLPYRNDEIESRLYYLNRRDTLNIQYFQDELTFLSHLLTKYRSISNLSQSCQLQMLSKQLTFLSILKNKISADLNEYRIRLKNTLEIPAENSRSNLAELQTEEVRITIEIQAFFKRFAYTKASLFKLLRPLHLLRNFNNRYHPSTLLFLILPYQLSVY
ncbi:hypothetical protein [Desertivirga xinjiangensis]|uniref:hypothetical protein n=1 Tax=Desertivirga xinjiangensis TaxID=539206 RepID=UPI00210CE80A|nr:hypothetical protein [Pedobacter xinjiangensis]